MIQESVKDFMAFWDQKDKFGDGKESGDQIRVLAEAFRRIRSEYEAARKDVLSYAVPKRLPKSIGLAFSDFHTEEVSELTNLIENIENQQQDIEKSISEAVVLCEGNSYKVLERHARRTQQGITGSNQLARIQLAREARKPGNASLSMSEVAALPSIQKLEDNAAQIAEESQGEVLDYKSRLQRVSQIIDKWRLKPASHLIKHPMEDNSQPAPNPDLISFGGPQGQAFGYDAVKAKLANSA